LVRGPGLAATMSRYLIDRIEAASNIQLRPHTQLTQLHGDQARGLAAISWSDGRGGTDELKEIRHVFLFVGAEPETAWLGCEVAVDRCGFVRTGVTPTSSPSGWHPAPLETNVPGVFAVGDVRSGSVKRVGGAIGEGAAAVDQIHRYLAEPQVRFTTP